MIRCQLDTELPLEELRISVAEKRELDEPIESNGSVTLSGLPEGDLHLWFLQDEERLGEIKINAAKSGELIRLEIRLVTGNAILLEEFRITGLTETSSPAPSPPTSPVDHTQTIDQTSDGETASSHCPAPGETFSRTGALTRVIDRDAFELQGDDRRLYTIYIGSSDPAPRRLRSTRLCGISRKACVSRFGAQSLPAQRAKAASVRDRSWCSGGDPVESLRPSSHSARRVVRQGISVAKSSRPALS